MLELHISLHNTANKPSTISCSHMADWARLRASAYLTRLGKTRNRLYVMLNWTTAMLFGRDMSRW